MEFGVFLCVPSLEDITIFKFQFIFCEYICLLLSACTLLMLLVATVNNRNNISRVLIFASLIFRISAKKTSIDVPFKEQQLHKLQLFLFKRSRRRNLTAPLLFFIFFCKKIFQFFLSGKDLFCLLQFCCKSGITRVGSNLKLLQKNSKFLPIGKIFPNGIRLQLFF